MSESLQHLKEARWWAPVENGKLHCYLCPRHCRIGDGQNGFCYIRKNIGGKLYNLGYSQPAVVHIDPIEKKPLNHFLPGTKVLSVGSAGCNMGCSFCQNWDISKSKADQVNSIHFEPQAVVDAAVESGCPSIAFTYNEPTIWGEYVVDTSKLAHRQGLKTVMVTNGYITPEALRDVYRHIDAANVDLKSFTEAFYSKITLSHLEPVLETLKLLRQETSVWLEVTNLMIPALNDSEDETRRLCRWLAHHLGDETPLHFTAFHPDYKLHNISNTPPPTLHRARQLALECGLKYVYEGNIFSGDAGHTVCPGCRRPVIRRSWHSILENRVRPDGGCGYCGYKIKGRFTTTRNGYPADTHNRKSKNPPLVV